MKCAACDLEHRDDDGWTPLFVAAINGHTSNLRVKRTDFSSDIVETLLDNSANIEVEDETYGWTPLFAAVSGNHIPVVSLLLKNHANVSK